MFLILSKKILGFEGVLQTTIFKFLMKVIILAGGKGTEILNTQKPYLNQ